MSGAVLSTFAEVGRGNCKSLKPVSVEVPKGKSALSLAKHLYKLGRLPDGRKSLGGARFLPKQLVLISYPSGRTRKELKIPSKW